MPDCLKLAGWLTMVELLSQHGWGWLRDIDTPAFVDTAMPG